MSTNRELTAYRQAAVHNASPVELVIAFYDLLVRDLRQVMAAIRAQQIEERVNRSNHAFDVLAQLEGLLDLENGGQTALELARIYSHIRAKLLEVQFSLDAAVLERQIEFLLQLRQGWEQAKAPATEAVNGHADDPIAPAIIPHANPYANHAPGLSGSSWSA